MRLAKVLGTVAALWLLLASFPAFSQSNIVFFLNEFGAVPATNRQVRLQAQSPFPANVQIMAADSNGVLITNLNVGVLYNGTISAPPAQIPFQIYIPPGSAGCADATNYAAVGGISTYPAGAVAPSIMMADSRYQKSGVTLSNNFYPLNSNPSNYVQNATLLTASNALQSQIVSGAVTLTQVTNVVNGQTNGLATVTYVNSATNGHVSASITNGFETTNHAGATFYPTSNPSVFVDRSITNGFSTLQALAAGTNAALAGAQIVLNLSNATILATAYNYVTNSGSGITNDINSTSNALVSVLSVTNIINGNAIPITNGTGYGTILIGNISVGIGNNFSSVTNVFIAGISNSVKFSLPLPNVGNSILGGAFNTNAAASYGTIGGGLMNRMDSYPFEQIWGGASNYLHTPFSTIVNGIGNYNVGSVSIILDGIQNTNSADETLIGGGQQNSVLNLPGGTMDSSVILSGQNNLIQRTSFQGGQTEYNSIFNGLQNTITTPGGIGVDAKFNTILNGQQNMISGTASGSTLVGSYITNLSKNNVFVANGGTPVTVATNNQAILQFSNGVAINTNGPLVGGGLQVNGSIILNGTNVFSAIQAASGTIQTNGFTPLVFTNVNQVVYQFGTLSNGSVSGTFNIGGGATYITSTNVLGVTNCAYPPVNGTYNNFGGFTWTNIFDARWTLSFGMPNNFSFRSNGIIVYLGGSSFLGTNYAAQGTAPTPTPIVYQGGYYNPFGFINNPNNVLQGTNDPMGVVIAPAGSQYVYFTNGLPKKILINTNGVSGWY